MRQYQFNLLLIAIILTGAYLTYYNFPPDEPDRLVQAQTEGAPPPTKSRKHTDGGKVNAVRDAMRRAGERLNGPDILSLAQATQIARILEEENTETVFGLKVRKDRKCILEQHYIEMPDGTLTAGVTCETPSVLVYDQFQDYTDEELVTPSFFDADASAELGRRLAAEEPQKARTIMIRAAALDPSNVEPLRWIAWENYSQGRNDDGSPALGPMSERYVLIRVAEDISGKSIYEVGEIKRHLSDGGLGAEEFTDLEARVSADVEYAREMQARNLSGGPLGGPLQ